MGESNGTNIRLWLAVIGITVGIISTFAAYVIANDKGSRMRDTGIIETVNENEKVSIAADTVLNSSVLQAQVIFNEKLNDINTKQLNASHRIELLLSDLKKDVAYINRKET